ncbi:hypothetical protein BDK92_1520 [Micromonospora pisi]|uniref:Uncharacterized protein n=1 Tax=Micromonospora pisi TaxID=589240 RepID=A0A495JE17_9ACTN|nr:hypothetical protein [Micromonospora pisi]RKR87246.1 hypothetical protein BDK92_1520 [Micromonospora pisi]
MTLELPQPFTAISSDVVNSSAGGYPRHTDLGTAAEATITAGIERCRYAGTWIRSGRGDGELTLAPANVPSAWLLTEFVDSLRVTLLDYNRNKDAEHKLRLRVGIDSGDVHVDQHGVPRGGDAIVVSARLRDSTAAREALAAIPSAPLVVVLSDRTYQRAVPYGALGLEERQFRRVLARVQGKEFAEVCWLHVPGHQPPFVTGAQHEPSPPPAPEPPPAAATAGPSTNPAPGGAQPGSARTGDVTVHGIAAVDRSIAVNHGGIHFGENAR